MGIVYVPNRKIIGNVKPDIPLEVDWRNPITNGLLASVTADGQYLYDRVSGLVSSSATIGTPLAGVGLHGRYTDLTAGSGSGISIPLPAWANNHDTTHHFGIDLKSVTGWAPIFEIFSGTTSSLYFGVNDWAAADLYVSPAAGTNIDIPGCATAILGAYQDCVLTYSADTSFIAFYIDGKLFYSTGIGGALYPTAISASQIGFMSSASFNQKGNLHYYNLFDRVLSLPEIQEISANPYQVVKSTRKSLYFGVSGGGTGFSQAVSSTLTLGATYGRAIARAVAASATPQATTVKATARALTGSVTGTGTETEHAGIGIVVTGTIAMGATLARAFSRTITGVVSFAGATLRNTARALAASISSTGTETEQAGIGLAVAGSIAMAAVVSTARQFTLALSAAIALGGAVARGAGRAVSGTLSATANVSRATGRTLAGVLTATGTILRNLGTSLAVAGSIALGAVVSAVKGIASLTRSVMALLGVGN